MRISTPIVSPAALLLLGCATWPAETPEAARKFEFADVHPLPKPAGSTNQFMRNNQVRNGRYQIHTAPLLDLIYFAWGYDADNVPGGAASIDVGRFEIGARVATGTPPDDGFALEVGVTTKIVYL